MKILFFITGLLLIQISANSQKPTQTIRGVVLDEASKQPVPFANVVLQNTQPLIGTVTDTTGNFTLKNVPVGRYNLEASSVGYEGFIIKELLVTSAKAVTLRISLKEVPTALDEVVVRPTVNKAKPLNKMATNSARMLSVEEAQRYAGGFDDPARLVSSFAGVASGVNNNAIVVRGNSPKFLQWRMEGVEIPNPNHFADLQSFGGGAVTGLSGQLLANSDFLTGAFPAEYNNALSGVFDIYMRTGNSADHEHTIQAGALGIDLASEGPFSRKGNASYLFNYRYSTFGLVGQITNAEEGIDYQDLSFKLNFPTRKAGTISFWGIGLVDRALVKAKEDSTEWYYSYDREEYDSKQFSAASGINHKILLNSRQQLKSVFATTVRGIDWEVDQLDSMQLLQPQSNVQGLNLNYVFNSTLNSKISKRHMNKSGITVTGLQYDMLMEEAPVAGAQLNTITDENGLTSLISVFSSSRINLTNRLTLNTGLNAQLFTLNNKYTVEPRLGLEWLVNEKQTLSLAYGLHSRLERINIYFTKSTTGEAYNRNLDFSKSNHFVLGYTYRLTENLLFSAEPYFQYLFDIPVVENTPISLINLKGDWFVNYDFVNEGEGRNYGIDLTLEKYMSSGYYYLLTASLFKSEYKGGDDKWYDTRFDQGYLVNVLGGKEWQTGRFNQNVFSINARLTYQGGERYTPYFESESIETQEVLFDEDNPYTAQFDPAFIMHFSISYKINRPKSSHEFALKVLNATSYGDFNSFEYNYIENSIDKTEEVIMIPNLSYKVEF